jgi:hypothetical protein
VVAHDLCWTFDGVVRNQLRRWPHRGAARTFVRVTATGVIRVELL